MSGIAGASGGIYILVKVQTKQCKQESSACTMDRSKKYTAYK